MKKTDLFWTSSSLKSYIKDDGCTFRMSISEPPTKKKLLSNQSPDDARVHSAIVEMNNKFALFGYPLAIPIQHLQEFESFCPCIYRYAQVNSPRPIWPEFVLIFHSLYDTITVDVVMTIMMVAVEAPMKKIVDFQMALATARWSVGLCLSSNRDKGRFESIPFLAGTQHLACKREKDGYPQEILFGQTPALPCNRSKGYRITEKLPYTAW